MELGFLVCGVSDYQQLYAFDPSVEEFVVREYVKDRSTSLVVAQLIAAFEIAYGAWAVAESRMAFFAVMFIVPGILALIAASGGTKKVAIAA
jgi:hypothetical protein